MRFAAAHAIGAAALGLLAAPAPAHPKEASSATNSPAAGALAPRGQVSSDVALAMGWTRERSRGARRDAFQRLGPELGPADVAALRGLLAQRFSAQRADNSLSFNAIKNDAVNVLLRQKAVPAGLGRELAAMALDDRHDEVWRDYCVQYLALYWRRRWPPGKAATSDRERAAMVDAYARCVAARDKPIAGTALLGMYSLCRDCEEFDARNVSGLALNLAEDPGACEPARVSALQVCAQAGNAAVLPLARRLARESRSVQLRISAVAAIGLVGEAEDAALLKALAGAREGRIRVAAGAALRRLESRT